MLTKKLIQINIIFCTNNHTEWLDLLRFFAEKENRSQVGTQKEKSQL